MRLLLRQYMYPLLLLAVGLPAAQLVFWIVDAIEDYRAPPPVKAAREFLGALRSDDCARALTLLSAESRGAVAGEPTLPPGRYSYCWPTAARRFHSVRPSSAQLSSLAAGRAVLTLERHEADPKSFLIPGFWATRSIVTPVTIDMAEEAGAWKVVLRGSARAAPP